MTPSLRGARVAILTLSDTVSRGEQADTSGDAIAEIVSAHGADVVARDLLPDDQARIAEQLRAYADGMGVDLVLTTGGSGVAPRDVTPEATLQIVDRLVPGIVEAARTQTLTRTPLAMVARGVAGIRRHTLIINLPGSPKAVREWMDVILPALGHAIELLRDQARTWGEPHKP